MASVPDSLAALAARSPSPPTIARVGLGLTILLAGVHKLLDPAAWAVYVTDWLAPWLVVSPVAFMLVNGVLEVGFGGAILAVVAALDGGRFADVLVRDVGLAALAWAVTVRALRADG